MIVVNRANSNIKITGHAVYAEPGKDIVCAGVSTLVQNLIASLDMLVPGTLESTEVNPGYVEIKHRNLSEHAKMLVDSFFIGVNLIANEYPEHVKITYG